jgi:hypothetical protein
MEGGGVGQSGPSAVARQDDYGGSGRTAGSPGLGLRLWLAYMSLVLSAAILLMVGLVPDWAHWYSSHLALRQQTEAFLDGPLALSTSPEAAAWAMVWDNGGVQHVWGLGVALWRLPFEAVAKLFGQPAFPDRLAFWLAVALVAYLVLWAFTMPPEGRHLQDWTDHFKSHPEKLSAVLLLLFFPPFLSLCQARFSVYEEVQAYSVLTGITLLAGTMLFVRNPKWSVYLAVAGLAGLAAFVRPTAGVYGVVTLLVLLWHARKLDWAPRRLLAGVLLFAAGGLLLFLANLHRFGSGFEFGHGLNLNGIHTMRFASRFDYPYRQESFRSAAGELAACLFFLERKEGSPGGMEITVFKRSDTLRWRQLYFPTYNMAYLIPLLGLAGWFFWRCGRRWYCRDKTPLSEPELLAFWCVGCTVPLLLFYLRFPFLNSRYLLDFAPGFAAGLLALVYAVQKAVAMRLKLRRWFNWVLATAVLSWWGYHAVGVAEFGRGFISGHTLSREQLIRQMEAEPSGLEPVPPSYSLGMGPAVYANRLNGSGWDAATGHTKAAVVLFVENPRYLELEVAPVAGVDLRPEDYAVIQAQVGLEALTLQSITPTEEGQRLFFAGPRRTRYRSGIQTVFIGFMTAEDLHTGDSDFRLLAVRW